MPSLAVAPGSALKLRYLRSLVFKMYLYRAGQALRFQSTSQRSAPDCRRPGLGAETSLNSFVVQILFQDEASTIPLFAEDRLDHGLRLSPGGRLRRTAEVGRFLFLIVDYQALDFLLVRLTGVIGMTEVVVKSRKNARLRHNFTRSTCFYNSMLVLRNRLRSSDSRGFRRTA